MKKLMLGILLLPSLSLFAQEPLHYSVNQNDPENLSYFSVGIEPMNCLLDKSNDFVQALNYSPFVCFMYNNKFALDVGYIRSYTKYKEYSSTSKNGNYGNPENGIKNYSDLYLMGKFYFTKSVKEKKEDIHLKSSGKVDHYIRTSLNVCKMWGIRGGIEAINKPVYAGENNLSLSAYDVDDPTKQMHNLSGDYTTMARYNRISFGISFLRVSDANITVEGYGERTKEESEELYVDIQHVGDVTYDNIKGHYTGYGSTTVSMLDVSNTPVSNWGLRAGYMNYNNNDLGVNYGVELGYNTGPQYSTEKTSNNLFLSVRLGIAFAKRFNKE